MAVYERTYKRYTGAVTPQWGRFSVLPRYAFQDLFKSRLFLAFFVLSLVFPLLNAAVIYLRHNAAFLEAFPNFPLGDFLAIDAAFFRRLMRVQLWFAFLLSLVAGPGLVSRDLANNALPLYLARPFSRREYVFGKFSVLAALLSTVTWIPGWALFALQGNFEGLGWMVDNARIAAAIFIGSWAWILTVSLLALALSAWLKWRPVAAFLMLAVLLAGGFFGNVSNALFSIEWANVINLVVVIVSILDGLFGLRPSTGVPPGLAWIALATFCGLCLLLLHRKVRAYEVVG